MTMVTTPPSSISHSSLQTQEYPHLQVGFGTRLAVHKQDYPHLQEDCVNHRVLYMSLKRNSGTHLDLKKKNIQALEQAGL